MIPFVQLGHPISYLHEDQTSNVIPVRKPYALWRRRAGALCNFQPAELREVLGILVKANVIPAQQRKGKSAVKVIRPIR